MLDRCDRGDAVMRARAGSAAFRHRDVNSCAAGEILQEMRVTVSSM
jgi:hypothetical protein